MKNKGNKICITTVMDDTDPDIVFDERGECHYVKQAKALFEKYWFPNEEGRNRLEKMVEQIRKDGKGRKYDCIIGLSGGLDSSYLAYKMAEFDLRVLAVHVDGGWNSETSVQNIEKIIKYNNWDLHTYVINWPEMKDLQLAYVKAGLVNQDVPQDHAFFARMWTEAVNHNVKWALSGGNLASESFLPLAWRGHDAMDATHLLSVHKKFGQRKLSSYPVVGFFKYNFHFRLIKGMKVIKPLNLMPYIRKNAIRELEDNTGWKSYGDKHHESIFTKFFQGYYLPTKFGFDKRKAHLSCLILSGQISRKEALNTLSNPPYDLNEIEFQKEYIAKKLGISKEHLELLIDRKGMGESNFESGQKLKSKLFATKQLVSKFIKLKGQDYG